MTEGTVSCAPGSGVKSSDFRPVNDKSGVSLNKKTLQQNVPVRKGVPTKTSCFFKAYGVSRAFFGGEALNFHNAFVGPGRIEHRPGSTTDLFKATVFLEHS